MREISISMRAREIARRILQTGVSLVIGVTGVWAQSLPSPTFDALHLRTPLGVESGGTGVGGGVINLQAYGADATGVADVCAAALPAAIAALPAAGGVLYFPSGTYSLATCAISISSKPVTIYGDGAGLTTLNFGSATGGAAGIITSTPQASETVVVHDLTLNASVVTANPAIFATTTVGASTWGLAIPFIGYNLQIGGTGTAYWQYGVKCSGCANGVLSHAQINGYSGGATSAGVASSNMTAALYPLNQANAFTVDHLVTYFAKYGVYVDDDTEGLNVSQSQFVAENYDSYYDTGAITTSSVWNSDYSATYLGGNYYAGGNNPQITNSRFDKYIGSSANWCGITLADGSSSAPSNTSQIDSNTFIGQDLSAGTFVVGATYVITFVGSTNFTAIGASANTVGVSFVATGVGSGTGAASQAKGGNAISVCLGAHAEWNDITNNKAFQVDYFANESSGTSPTNTFKDNSVNLGTQGWWLNYNPFDVKANNTPPQFGTDPVWWQFGLNATAENVGGLNHRTFETDSTVATTITTLQGGYPGLTIQILCADTDTTLSSGASMAFAGGSNYVCPRVGATVTLLFSDIWREIARAN